jgi:hypothetical protein
MMAALTMIVALITSHIVAFKVGWMLRDRKHRHLRD